MFHQTDWCFLAVRQDVGASNRVCNIVKIGCPLTFLLVRNLFFIVRAELRVVERKRYVTRNLLKISLSSLFTILNYQYFFHIKYFITLVCTYCNDVFFIKLKLHELVLFLSNYLRCVLAKIYFERVKRFSKSYAYVL